MIHVLLLLLACGAPTANVNGLAVDTDGNLVVAYGGYNRIRVLDPADGTVLRELNEGVRVPDDVEVRDDGTLWWTSLLSGEIGRADTNGDVTILADIGIGANPIALSPDGRLIVGRCGLGFGADLYALDPDAPSEPEVVVAGLGEGCALNGMVFGADGWLYGAQPTQGRILRVDLGSGAVEVLAEGLGPESYAVALDPSGAVFALDGERVVSVVDGAVETFVELPIRGDNLVFSADGAELFVSTGPDMRVLAYPSAGGEPRTVVEGLPE